MSSTALERYLSLLIEGENAYINILNGVDQTQTTGVAQAQQQVGLLNADPQQQLPQYYDEAASDLSQYISNPSDVKMIISELDAINPLMVQQLVLGWEKIKTNVLDKIKGQQLNPKKFFDLLTDELKSIISARIPADNLIKSGVENEQNLIADPTSFFAIDFINPSSEEINGEWENRDILRRIICKILNLNEKVSNHTILLSIINATQERRDELDDYYNKNRIDRDDAIETILKITPNRFDKQVLNQAINAFNKDIENNKYFSIIKVPLYQSNENSISKQDFFNFLNRCASALLKSIISQNARAAVNPPAPAPAPVANQPAPALSRSSSPQNVPPPPNVHAVSVSTPPSSSASSPSAIPQSSAKSTLASNGRQIDRVILIKILKTKDKDIPTKYNATQIPNTNNLKNIAQKYSTRSIKTKTDALTVINQELKDGSVNQDECFVDLLKLKFVDDEYTKSGFGLSRGKTNKHQINGRFYTDRRLINDQSVFEIRYIKNGHLGSVKPVVLTSQMKKIVNDILDGRFDKSDFHKLTSQEKHFIKTIDHKLDLNLHLDEDDGMNSEYNVLRGEWLAGNNNVDIRRKLKKYIYYFATIGKMSKFNANKLIADLEL